MRAMNDHEMDQGVGRRGFTLLELLLAVTILAAMSAVMYMSVGTVIKGWRRGMALSDRLHHGDFVMDQLVMALRSAYVPGTQGGDPRYGFWLEDNGDSEHSSDVMSWVKLGGALVGRDTKAGAGVHRVQFYVADYEGEKRMAMVKAWRLHGQPEDFDPEKLEPAAISSRVRGFNCRAAVKLEDGEPDWMDEWEETNRVPPMLELTLYMDPLEEGGEALELKRAIVIPVAPLSWRGGGGENVPRGTTPADGKTGEAAPRQDTPNPETASPPAENQETSSEPPPMTK